MLGISFSEFILIIFAALVLIRPKDIPYLIQLYKNLYQKVLRFNNEVFSYFRDEVDMAEEIKSDINYVLDDKGVPQKTYDISELKNQVSLKKKSEKEKELSTN